MTERTWEIADLDGSNKRTVTLAQYRAELDAAKAKAAKVADAWRRGDLAGLCGRTSRDAAVVPRDDNTRRVRPAMSKVRLNQHTRNALTSFAFQKVRCAAEEQRLADAYEKAAPLVRAIVEAVYQPRDMKVCRKYQAAHVDDCIKLNLTAGGVVQFVFEDKTGPLVVRPTYTGKIYQADEAATQAVSDWIAATDALKAARTAKLDDYKSLITFARTLEDVAEVWPEAEELRAKFSPNSTAIVAFNPAIAARIKADVESRAPEHE